MILSPEDAIYAANVFVDNFSNFGRIDDYLRKVKLERMESYPTALPGMGPQDEMFSDFSMNPNDIDLHVDHDQYFLKYEHTIGTLSKKFGDIEFPDSSQVKFIGY